MVISIDVIGKIHSAAVLLSIVAATIAAFTVAVTAWTSTILDRHADEKISSAATVAEVAKESAAQANVEAEKLKQQNLKLELELEALRSERLKLERRLGPRALSNQQSEQLIQALHKCEIGSKFLIGFAPNSEMEIYAKTIAAAIQSAGHNVTLQPGQITFLGSSNTGLRIVICHGSGASVAEHAFRSVFPDAQIKRDITLEQIRANEPSRRSFDSAELAAYIYVSPKPPYL